MPAARTVRATPAHSAPSTVEELHHAHPHDRNVGHHHQQRNLTNGARWRLHFRRRARRLASPVDSLQCGRQSEQRRPERGKLPGRSGNAFRRPGGGFGARQRHHQAACTDNGKNGQSGGPQRIPPAAYRESPAFSRPPLRLAPGRGTTPPTAERLRSWRRCSDDNTLAVMKRWAARSAPDGARAPRPIPAAPHPLPTPHPALGTRTAPCYRPERCTERDDAPAPARRTRP